MKKSYHDVLEIVGAFAVAFLFYQAMILATGTQLPIVSVVSDSMYHRAYFNQWWGSSGKFYTGLGITSDQFKEFKDFNGLSRGDLLLVIKPQDLKVGDIVIYQRDAASFTIVHRVVQIDGDKIVTKGDNNPGPDTPIIRQNVQGKVVFAVPVLGYPRFLLHLVGI